MLFIITFIHFLTPPHILRDAKEKRSQSRVVSFDINSMRRFPLQRLLPGHLPNIISMSSWPLFKEDTERVDTCPVRMCLSVGVFFSSSCLFAIMRCTLFTRDAIACHIGSRGGRPKEAGHIDGYSAVSISIPHHKPMFYWLFEWVAAASHVQLGEKYRLSFCTYQGIFVGKCQF